MRLLIGIILALVFSSAALGEGKNASSKLVSYPLTLSEDCRDGRAKIYDECGDQLAIYKAAEARAKVENKTLLVSYGAEWCIWCHVFVQYLAGGKDEFTYTYGDESDRERWTATLMERAKKKCFASSSRSQGFRQFPFRPCEHRIQVFAQWFRSCGFEWYQ